MLMHQYTVVPLLAVGPYDVIQLINCLVYFTAIISFQRSSSIVLAAEGECSDWLTRSNIMDWMRDLRYVISLKSAPQDKTAVEISTLSCSTPLSSYD